MENSLKMLAALHNAGVPAEAHFFPHGGHGMFRVHPGDRLPRPLQRPVDDLCLDWLDNTFGYQL